ncbi:MAG: purine-nucleoside phosphorylase [Clostridia bacterium]|nr:purine-nucleoside phosphorylase [Clostridia bacterium]
MNTPTPHINAAPGDFADTVLLPGDPKRSLFIAENFLDEAVLVNDVRGVNGYTGYYKGKRVSVMASGMGMPAVAIYSTELYKAFGVKNIIRAGSAGAYREDMKLGDIFIPETAITESNIAVNLGYSSPKLPIADPTLHSTAVSVCRKRGYRFHTGTVFSADVFYSPDPDQPAKLAARGIAGCEMESSVLFMIAELCGGRAVTMCTVSDNLITNEYMSAESRENSFVNMITAALETAVLI